MQSAHIDFETYSVVDLTKAGVYRYAQDPNTYAWGFSYRIGNVGPVKQWRPGGADPVDLLQHVSAGLTIVAHNAAFERLMWNWVLPARYGVQWPQLRIEQQDCTMARAAAMAYPQKLEKLGIALHTNFQKDMEGHKLMMKVMKPRRYNEDGSITWWDDPHDIDRNMVYCDQDVRVETNADEILPPLTARWRRVWEFDQHINDRGVRFDMDAARKAADLVEFAKKQNDKLMRELTDREVPKCSNDAKIIAWLNGRGIQCTSLAKGEVDDVIFLASVAEDQKAHDVIKLRQAAWKTSTAKYKAMGQCVSYDNRIRGLLNFNGASTGRWAGRLVQAQNFPRVDPDDKLLQTKLKWLLEMLLDHGMSPRDVYEQVATVHGPLDVLELLSKLLRAMMLAKEGKKFVSGDFSNVEGRFNAWLAGEEWKLQAFRDYDAGTGADLYKLAYAKSFGVDVNTVGKGRERQIGKVQELSLGYQGSVAAYIKMGANYGVDPFSLSKPVFDATSPEQWEATQRLYHRVGTAKLGLFEREWTALKVLVNNWRAAHPAIVQSWWDYQDAAVEAVAAPGTVVACVQGRIQYYSDQRHLWCVLPSGRMLAYAEPEIVTTARNYTKDNGETYTKFSHAVHFMGTDTITKQWSKQSLYGGKQCENVVQAGSCDLLVDAMFRIESAGFPVVLTVHDEILAEPDAGRDDLNPDLFSAIMAQSEPWADGLPIAVSAWEDVRYVK